MILTARPGKDVRNRLLGWFRRQAKMEDVEWLMDQGCTGYDLERAFPDTNLFTLERLAQRHNRYDIARRLHAAAMDKSAPAYGKPGPVLYDRYKEAS